MNWAVTVRIEGAGINRKISLSIGSVEIAV